MPIPAVGVEVTIVPMYFGRYRRWRGKESMRGNGTTDHEFLSACSLGPILHAAKLSEIHNRPSFPQTRCIIMSDETEIEQEAQPIMTIVKRLAECDWDSVATSLTDCGLAQLPPFLSPQECRDLIGLYGQAKLFRSRIDMARYRFGRGEYQYFHYPLPALVEDLRQGLYSKLVHVANTWAGLFGTGDRFPLSLNRLLALCHQRGQTRPTPLLLHYRPDDFNCLHQDIYGEIAFPFQVVFFLSQPARDYSGGEFLLAEQMPRAQTMVRALLPQQGQGLVITTRYRPARGKRGVYKITVRHGVSPVTGGERWSLGIIFHDAK